MIKVLILQKYYSEETALHSREHWCRRYIWLPMQAHSNFQICQKVSSLFSLTVCCIMPCRCCCVALFAENYHARLSQRESLCVGDLDIAAVTNEQKNLFRAKSALNGRAPSTATPLRPVSFFRHRLSICQSVSAPCAPSCAAA